MRRSISTRKARLIRKGIRLHRNNRPQPSGIFSSLTVALACIHEKHYVHIRPLNKQSRELRAEIQKSIANRLTK